jgi:site-specific recombinase XerD
MTTDLHDLLTSWSLHLRAQRKSPQTIRSYTIGVDLYLRWCATTGRHAQLDQATVTRWIAHLVDTGAEGSTARARQLSLRRFSAWLTDQGELDRDDLLGLVPPKLDIKVVESLTDEQLAALVAACAGRSFRDKRDQAIVRLMAETGLRSEELLSMTVADTNPAAGLATIRRGKGGKGRVVPFGPRTAVAIDSYLRMRRRHRLAGTPTLWLGDRGKEFAYFGLRDTLRYRGRLAGIEAMRPHRLRHTAAARWLDAGGSEGGLMSLAGWSRRDMIDRYTRATSERRAADEARRLGLGEI